MKIAGFEPTAFQIDKIATLATAALPAGAIGDEQTWLTAVRKVQGGFDWSNHPFIRDRYRYWRVQTRQLAITQLSDERHRFWEHARCVSLAQYSYLIYKPLSELRQSLDCEKTKKRIDQYTIFCDKRWKLRGIGYVQDDRPYLVFRGTDCLRNWLLNFLFFRRRPGVHRGFLKAWRRLEEKVREWLSGLPSTPTGLTLTGHSLGGAIAVLAANSLHGDYEIGKVITFGSPRLAKPKFAEAYKKNGLEAVTRRYIHETDLVPRLVPPWMYGHLGEQFYITDSGSVSVYAPGSTFRWKLDSFKQSNLVQVPSRVARRTAKDIGYILEPLGEAIPASAYFSASQIGDQRFSERRRKFPDLARGFVSTNKALVLTSLTGMIGSWILLLAAQVAAVAAAVLLAMYEFVRVWLRGSAVLFDKGEHNSELYQSAFQKKIQTYFDERKRFRAAAPRKLIRD
jgi:hypothetical protein